MGHVNGLTVERSADPAGGFTEAVACIVIDMAGRRPAQRATRTEIAELRIHLRGAEARLASIERKLPPAEPVTPEQLAEVNLHIDALKAEVRRISQRLDRIERRLP